MDTIDKQDDGQYPFYVRSQTVERTNDWSFDGEAVLTAGDGAGVGKVFHYANGKFDYHQRVYKFSDFRDALGRFFFLYLKATLRFEVMRGTAKSTVESLRLPMLRDFPISLPPYVEQAGIIRFLDHADERIQRYISVKQKLITLLEEQKQTVIHQGVTGQIDVGTGEPYCEYKNSGVEWLGRVPNHWSTKRTKLLLKEVDVRSMTGEETHLSMSQALGLVPSHHVEQTLSAKSHVGAKICQKGDLVLNRLKAHLGVFAVAGEDGLVSPDYSVYRSRGNAEMDYLELAFRLAAMRTELRKRTKGIVEGFWRLYSDDLFEIRLPIPPIDEQRKIAAFARRASEDTARTSSQHRRLAGLASDLRIRLIADVVTGKLDVREAAAKLRDFGDGEVEDHQDTGLATKPMSNFGEMDSSLTEREA